MRIGIIGYGKMGKDIFSYYREKMKKSSFVVYVRHDSEGQRVDFEQKLQKDLKRKRINELTAKERKRKTLFTEKLEELSTCDMVIECISEDLKGKKELFTELEGIVNKECILASNTSSLSLEQVFDGNQNKEKCVGLHFFYPMKLSGYVECNLLDETDERLVRGVGKKILQLGKTPLFFQGDSHMYLNQYLSRAVFMGFACKDHYRLSFAEAKKCLETVFPMTGLFGLVDGIGLSILAKNPEGFGLQRNQKIVAFGTEYLKKMIAEGCPIEPGAVLSYYAEKEGKTTCGISEELQQNLRKDLIAGLIHEAAWGASQYEGEQSELLAACQDVMGLEKSLGEYAQEMGYEEMCLRLANINEKIGPFVEEIVPKAVWTQIYSR